MKTAKEHSQQIWKTSNDTNIPNHKIRPEIEKLVAEIQKEAYNQALADVWAAVSPVDKNIRDGRYIITSTILFKLGKENT